MMREEIGLYILLFFPFFCAVFIYVMNRIFRLQHHPVLRIVQATRTVEPVEPSHTVEAIHSVEPLQVAEPFQGSFDATEPIQVAEILPTSSDI